MSDQLLTVPEVSSYLRLSKSQVYLMLKKRQLPYIRVSERRIVIRQSDLERWLQRQAAMEPSQIVFMLDKILDN